MNKFSESAEERFLVVDDDANFCSILERVLLRHGYSVVIAHTSTEALQMARQFQPSHAIVDLKLENESGLLLIKPLLILRHDMKIVVLTGYGSIATAVDAIKEGAVNYLSKPVDYRTLISAFESAENVTATEDEAAIMSLKRLEWEHIQRVLDEHDGNISATARSMGMHRRTLQRKLQKRPVKR